MLTFRGGGKKMPQHFIWIQRKEKYFPKYPFCSSNYHLHTRWCCWGFVMLRVFYSCNVMNFSSSLFIFYSDFTWKRFYFRANHAAHKEEMFACGVVGKIVLILATLALGAFFCANNLWKGGKLKKLTDFCFRSKANWIEKHDDKKPWISFWDA